MSKYTDTKRIRRMLEEGLGDKIVFNKRWNQTFKPSQWAKGKPFGLMTHHTAGAAGDNLKQKHLQVAEAQLPAPLLHRHQGNSLPSNVVCTFRYVCLGPVCHNRQPCIVSLSPRGAGSVPDSL